MVMVTNPVDVLTYMALKFLDWPRNRVIGSGTVLDTARFRYMLSRHCGIDTRNVHAYVLDEHGDSEVCLSVPCVIGESGVERIVTARLYSDEQAALETSAKTIGEVLKSIEL